MNINPKKNIAQFCNIVTLVGFFWLVAARGFETSYDADDWLIVILFITTPVVNLVALHGNANNSSWLALYFKRKALEEEKKIQELTNKK